MAWAVVDANNRAVANVTPEHPDAEANARLIVWAVNQAAGTRHARLRRALEGALAGMEEEAVDEKNVACFRCEEPLGSDEHPKDCTGRWIVVSGCLLPRQAVARPSAGQDSGKPLSAIQKFAWSL